MVILLAMQYIKHVHSYKCKEHVSVSENYYIIGTLNSHSMWSMFAFDVKKHRFHFPFHFHFFSIPELHK